MSRFRLLIAFVSLVVPILEATAAPPAPGIYKVEPTADIQKLLNHLKERDRPFEAIKALAARDDAAPYLRLELQTAVDIRYKKYLTEAIANLEAKGLLKGYERNKTRYATWAENGRLDMCAELLVVCPDKDDAAKLISLTMPVRKKVVAGLGEAVGPHDDRKFWGPMPNLPFTYEHESGGDLTLDPHWGRGWPAIVRADRCTVQVFCKANWFVAARSYLRDQLPPHQTVGEWLHSVVLVNDSTRLPRVTESLIVCDGDIDLVPGLDFSVIIANGSIRSKEGGAGRKTYLCATEDIVMARSKTLGNNIFHAGRTVTFAEKLKPSDRVREKQKTLPFGIQFLDPEEFGVVLAAQNGGVQVMEIAANSPFAKYGVEDGDIITAIDGVSATTLPIFRRQLRRGVIAESVVLNIRRGKTPTTRIVFLDGIPVPTAPMPREATK